VPCQRLEAAVLASDAFVSFGKGFVLFVHERPEDELAGLSAKLGVQGFPTILFIDGAGDVIATHTGSRSLAALEATARRAQALEERLARGDKGARIDVIIADLEGGRTKLDDLEKKLEGLGELTAEQKHALSVAKANGEVDAICASSMDRAKVGKKLLARYKAGKPAPTGVIQATAYWYGLLEHAERLGDAALYAEVLDRIKKGEPAYHFSPTSIADMEKTLERLRK